MGGGGYNRGRIFYELLNNMFLSFGRELSNNKITTIPKGAFTGLTSLFYLYVSLYTSY